LRASRARLWLAEAPVPIVELRKPRNLMLHKVVRNIVDIRRLHKIMQKTPVTAAMRYHRWSREDVENIDSAQTTLIIEMGRLHRGETMPASSVQEPVRGYKHSDAVQSRQGLRSQLG
jgi:hypothetical protein